MTAVADELSERMRQAADLHKQGRLDEAAREYLAVKASNPSHFFATYNLGIIAAQQGRIADGEVLIAEATRLNPSIAQAALVHGKLLTDMGRIDEAVACYDSLLAREPENLSALNDRATALFKQSRFDEALEDLDHVLALEPGNIFALFNRATALIGLHQTPEAFASLDAALALKPDFVDALLYKGNVLREQGHVERAAQVFAEAIAINPARHDILNNHGSALLSLGRFDEALEAFDKALALQPAHLDALVNRGRTLGKLGRTAEELKAYERALALNPKMLAAHLSRGIALYNLNRFVESLASLDQALAIDPRSPPTLLSRASTLVGLDRREEALADLDAALQINLDFDALNNRAHILRQLSRFEEFAQTFTRLVALAPHFAYAEGNLLSARLQCCDWTGLVGAIERVRTGVAQGRPVANPFMFLQVSDAPQELLQCTRAFVADKYRNPGTPWTPGARDAGRLRIAYLSADLQTHATAQLMAGMFEAHDRRAFETVAVSFAPEDGTPMRGRLMAAFDRFIDATTMDDAAVAAMLRAMPVDIAVDLKGFTNNARPQILLDRVAPIQVNFLGYPGTWGNPCMDYLIADRHIVPRAHEAFYSEKIAALPDAYQPNDRKRFLPARAPTRAEVGLPENGIIFCCFNGNYKFMPAVFDVWMRLLQRVPGSVLWLLQTNDAAVRNLRREAAARGVTPDRLIFAPFIAPEIHLVRQAAADLFLDTLPVNAHTTTSDALWVGLPVLTCVGGAFAGRVAGSLLHAAGFPELVTDSLADYETRAFQLATTPGALPALKARLAERRFRCALFDTERFCRHLEAAYLTMWERQRRGEPPASFDVAPLPF